MRHTINILLLISNSYHRTLAAFSIDIQKVQHVTKDNFHPNKHYYHNHNDDGQQRNAPYETPILIENALTKQQCDDICNTIMNELGNDHVTIQRKIKYDNGDVETELAEDTLNNAFEYMMKSHHHDSYFSFLEGLLDDNKNLDNVRHILRDARESLFDRNDNPHQTDLFRYFPNDVRPTDCVVVAGDGAASTLHRDPYEWTGTSLCLEGTKLWRFIAPPSSLVVRSPTTMGMMRDDDSQGVREIDDVLKSYRLPSVAWDDDAYLSAGWQSDLSLYASRRGDIPSARDFAAMEDDGGVERLVTHLEGIALDVDKLTPSDEIVRWLSRKSKARSLYGVVQKPGDLLIIPAYWWHQTYALQPSLAIASQRAGLCRDAKRVIDHIFDTVGVSDDEKKGLPTILQKVLKGPCDVDAMGPKDVVEALFQVLSSHE